MDIDNLSDDEKRLVLRHRQALEHEEYKYLHLLEDIMSSGQESDDRTGVGTKKIFGTQLKFSLRDSFPILTTKKVYWRGVVGELLWMIRGDTDANNLSKDKINIWNANTTREFLDKQGLEYPKGHIGPGYGWQWRRWDAKYGIVKQVSIKDNQAWHYLEYDEGRLEAERYGTYCTELPYGIDQLADALKKIRHSPDDRRILVSAWNPSQVPQMALPPCHLLFQFQVSNGELHCQWYQRSVDTFLGLPFNISSYALLTCLMARAAGLAPGTVTFCGGDVHVYKNHFLQVQEQLLRNPYKFPKLVIPDVRSLKDIEDLKIDDIGLEGYRSHPPIKAPMAV